MHSTSQFLIILRFFIDYRFSEFGVDGGPAAKALQPKFNTIVANISTRTGLVVPHIEVITSCVDTDNMFYSVTKCYCGHFVK